MWQNQEDFAQVRKVREALLLDVTRPDEVPHVLPEMIKGCSTACINGWQLVFRRRLVVSELSPSSSLDANRLARRIADDEVTDHLFLGSSKLKSRIVESRKGNLDTILWTASL